ncbi:MAG: hypothetical protein M1516_02225 [Firmicutes bacterium]|nr:hypothetical protein [Bacillota bacterium]
MEHRQHCATCVHIARVVNISPNNPSYFRCERLGFRTEPRYRFHCWVERPRTIKMAEIRLNGDG